MPVREVKNNATGEVRMYDTDTGSFVETPSIFERIGQMYSAAVKPITERVARNVAAPLQFLPGAVNRPKPTPDAPREEDRPGGLARSVAGLIVPQTPAQAILALTAPGVGKLGKDVLKVGGGTLGRAIKGGLLRTGAETAIGATTSALTGESPIKGGLEGMGVGLTGEVLNTISTLRNRKVLPRTTEGLARGEVMFGPQWVRAVTGDLPALAPHIRDYEDLQSLISNKVSGQIGREIYQPFRHALDVMLPNTRFTFPYLRPGRFGRLSINDPTISEILPNVDEKILRRAGQLTPNEALTVIQQLKDAAFNPAKDGAIRGAAKKFATKMEQDFTAVLNNTHPQLGNYYSNVKEQYSQLKGLQYAIRKNRAKLFPGAGERVGLDPVAWRETLRDAFEQVPDTLFPRLHNAVSFGGLHLGSGATYEPAQGQVRTSTEAPGGIMRFFSSVLRPSPKILLPNNAPRPPLSPLLRSLPAMTMSGLEATTEEGD